MKKILFIAAAAMLCIEAFGWGGVGHRVIVEIAQRNLTEKAKENISKYMNYDLKKEAVWMDTHRKDEPIAYTTAWHVYNVDATDTYDPNPRLYKGDCVHGVKVADYNLRRYTELSDSAVVMNLRMILHFVGDMHCPTHSYVPGPRCFWPCTLKGKKYKFLNNVGFGIDGYCCEVGDKQRAAGKQKINYTLIAIKGLLGGYKKVCATVKIDGMTKSYKNVWLAPTMNGRFVGGGMMACPEQDRLNEDGTVSLMVMHHPFNLKVLTVFPTIFKGEHVKYTKIVEQFKGYEIEVEFDRPTPLQIDGETIREVLSYKVWATPEYRKAALKELEAV